jgi:hypothetical protein
VGGNEGIEWNPSIFCEFEPLAKFHNPRTTPSGRKVCDTETEETKIIHKIVDAVTPNCSKRTLLEPKLFVKDFLKKLIFQTKLYFPTSVTILF